MKNNQTNSLNELRTGKLVEYQQRTYGIFINTEKEEKLILTPSGETIQDLENYDVKVFCNTAMCQQIFTSIEHVIERYENGDFKDVMGSLAGYPKTS